MRKNSADWCRVFPVTEIPWDPNWLKGRFGDEVRQTEIVDEERIEELPPFVGKEEVETL